MSYARFGWDNSDVYVYANVDGSLTCSGCLLNERWNYHSTQEMVDHLAKHVKAGHEVPVTLIPDLWTDDATNFPNSGNPQSKV